MGNWDFDGDEVLFFLLAGIVAFVGLYRWYAPLVCVARFGRRNAHRDLLGLTPGIALMPVIIVLMFAADPKYVVGHLDFQLLFFSGAMAWMWIGGWTCALLGLSLRDDAIERSNTASAVAISGVVVGISLIYAGSNIGAGPTIWTTIAPAAVSSCACLLVGWLLAVSTRISESIAIDHDLASAFRFAGFFIAAGMILGRASGGDWTSWESTFQQIWQMGWPVILASIVVMAIDVPFRPTPAQPKPSAFGLGFVPAAVLVVVAIIYVVALGPPDVGKHVVTFEEYMRLR